MFETAMILEALEKLRDAAHKNSRDKGFWNGDPTDGGNPDNVSIPTKILLMQSELVEMFEAYRKGKLSAPCDKKAHIIDPQATEPCEVDCVPCGGKGATLEMAADEFCLRCGGSGKNTMTGVRRLTNEEEELADAVIRILDYCGWKDLDIGRCILSKMGYNKTRPILHGKRC